MCINRIKNWEEKQEHELFIVPQMNRNIILGKNWLKQFGVHMSYDLGCIRAVKFYIKLEDLHISSIARLTSETIINRGKTTEAPALYKAVLVYSGDKDGVSMEEEISTQPAELDETNAVIPTGVKQQQSQSKQTRSAFPAE